MASLIILQDGQVAVVDPVNQNFNALNVEVRPVVTGGTGANALTQNGILIGNGTNPVTVTPAGPPGSILAVPDGGGAPAYRALQTGFYNMLFNGGMEVWGSGASAPPTGWGVTGTVTAAKVTAPASRIKIGLTSCSLTRAGGDGALYQDITAANGGLAYWVGRTVTAGCWVRATVALRAQIALYDGVGFSYSSTHTGSSAFEWLTVTRTIAAGAAGVQLQCQVVNGDTIVHVDGATLVEGPACAYSIPSGWRGRKGTLQFSTGQTGLTVNPTTYGLASTGANTAVVGVPYNGVARNLTVWGNAVIAGGVVDRLQANVADTALLATFPGATNSASDATNEVTIAKFVPLNMKSTDVGGVTHTATIEYEEIP